LPIFNLQLKAAALGSAFQLQIANRKLQMRSVMIRVVLPAHLRTLAGVDREVQLDGVADPVTPASILDALEAKYPHLRGTIRDQVTRQRRPLVRFFACEEDLSHDPMDQVLPDKIATGAEPFFIIGAIAGG
jgi:hypothetical protein